jgi:C-terminal topoisomerase domain
MVAPIAALDCITCELERQVPMEKIFNKSLLSKFHWAMVRPPVYLQPHNYMKAMWHATLWAHCHACRAQHAAESRGIAVAQDVTPDFRF